MRGGLGTGVSRKTGIHEGAVWSQVVQYVGSQACDYERIKDKGQIWGQRAETQGFSLSVDQGSNQETKTEVLRCYWKKGQGRSLFRAPVWLHTGQSSKAHSGAHSLERWKLTLDRGWTWAQELEWDRLNYSKCSSGPVVEKARDGTPTLRSKARNFWSVKQFGAWRTQKRSQNFNFHTVLFHAYRNCCCIFKQEQVTWHNTYSISAETLIF